MVQAASAFEKHNDTTHYILTLRDVPSQISVIRFEAQEQISGSYDIELNIAVNDVLNPGDLLGQHGMFEIDWDGEPRRTHGVVTEATHLGPLVEDDAHEYHLVISSPLSLLDINRQSRVFLGRDTQQILEQVLEEGGIARSDFKVELSNSYPQREIVVQYNETDFNFISRLMEHYGIYYYFIQDEEKAVLIIADNSIEAPPLAGGTTLPFRPTTGGVEGEETVMKLQQSSRVMTKDVRLKDYNYETPEAPLLVESSSRSPTSGSGINYFYGEHYESQEEGEQLARHRQQLLDWQRDIFLAETNCRGLVPGFVVAITNEYGETEGDFLVVSVTSSGDQSSAFPFGGGRKAAGSSKTYVNQVTMIRSDIHFRPNINEKRVPRVYGVFTARIESTGGDYAYLDEQGRYRMRLPFDLGEAPEGEASCAVRMMQPYSGSNYGQHFPLHAGAEVLVTGINGDINRPVIIGAVPNPDTASPTTNANHTQNIIRTWGGNELCMDDMKGQEKIELFTRDRKNILVLDANTDGHRLDARSEEGDAEYYAAKTILFESGDSFNVETGNDQIITVENRHQLITKNKDIVFKSAANIDSSAQKNIRMQAEEENMELVAEKDMLFEAGKSMSIRVIDEDLEVVVESGNLSIEAAKNITIAGQGGGPITIGQAGGTIEISTSGDLTINASSVEINGSSINIKGQQVGNN